MSTTSSNAFVTMPVDSVMYILLMDQATFEAIPVTEGKAVSAGNGKLVRYKIGAWNAMQVIFQYWQEAKETSDDV